MPIELSSSDAATAGGTIPPRCVFVTGPRGAGKTRWLQERIRSLAGESPPVRCAVVLAEEGRSRWENFVREIPGLSVRRLVLPCLCCPALADLPAVVQSLTASTGAARLFVEVPAVAAAGFIAEFDQVLGWPRRVVLCPGAAWTRAPRHADLPLFLSNLLALADTVVAPSPAGGAGQPALAASLQPTRAPCAKASMPPAEAAPANLSLP